MPDETSEEDTGNTRLYVLVSVLGLTVLSYIGGTFSATFETFPYKQWIKPAFRALAAKMQKRAAASAELTRSIWHRARFSGRGVVERTDGAFDGYTLYSSGHKSGAFLVDMEGEVVHEWNGEFRDVWPNPPHVDSPVPPKNIYWRRTHLFSNGDVLAAYAGAGDSPWGYGLAKFDRESNLIWKYSEHVHHDFDVADDGTIYAVVHRFRDTRKNPVRGVPQIPDQITEDYIVRLSPEGEELQRYSLVEGLADSVYLGVLQMQPDPFRRPMETTWDLLHANTVEVIGPEFAKHHDFAKPGDIMFSARDPDLVGFVDMEAERVEWATRGFWSEQHDPDALSNGNILVFDNNGHAGPGGASRIVEYNPKTNGLEWTYTGTPEHPFWSKSAGSKETLPNGNVLITSSLFGRVFEVNRAGEIVWEFRNPKRQRLDGQTYVPLILGARRFRSDELDFLEKR